LQGKKTRDAGERYNLPQGKYQLPGQRAAHAASTCLPGTGILFSDFAVYPLGEPRTGGEYQPGRTGSLMVFPNQKADFMAKNTSDKKQVSRPGRKERKGDTGRSSSEGRKQASGGSRNTNNQGRP
jgi:hypothetical protein